MEQIITRMNRTVTEFKNGNELHSLTLCGAPSGITWGKTYWIYNGFPNTPNWHAQAQANGVSIHVSGKNSGLVRRIARDVVRICNDNPRFWADLAVDHEFPVASMWFDEKGYCDKIYINADDYASDLDEIPF